MIRYTTPTITLVVDADLTGTDVYVSVEQAQQMELTTKKSREITVKNPNMSVSEGKTTLVFTLTQEQSAMFADNLPVEIQVNCITPEGTRSATEIATVNSFRNLLDEVIAYGN